ncbi:hypothetical protein pb186bvf_001989 [Paramecium bursaria]
MDYNARSQSPLGTSQRMGTARAIFDVPSDLQQERRQTRSIKQEDWRPSSKGQFDQQSSKKAYAPQFGMSDYRPSPQPMYQSNLSEQLKPAQLTYDIPYQPAQTQFQYNPEPISAAPKAFTQFNLDTNYMEKRPTANTEWVPQTGTRPFEASQYIAINQTEFRPSYLQDTSVKPSYDVDTNLKNYQTDSIKPTQSNLDSNFRPSYLDTKVIGRNTQNQSVTNFNNNFTFESNYQPLKQSGLSQRGTTFEKQAPEQFIAAKPLPDAYAAQRPIEQKVETTSYRQVDSYRPPVVIEQLKQQTQLQSQSPSVLPQPQAPQPLYLSMQPKIIDEIQIIEDENSEPYYQAQCSVATIKAKEIIEETLLKFTETHNVQYQVILTDRAKQFIDIQALSDQDEWNQWKQKGDPVLHIDLRKWADMMIICPLSANTLAKIANGICDNLLTCVIRAWEFQDKQITKPIYVAPAMNTQMQEILSINIAIRDIEIVGLFHH